MANISLIVAHDKNRGIGIDNQLPWHLAEDMTYFRNLTSSCDDATKKNVVIMGRNTWESIPEKYRPLPNRINVILSSTLNEDIENCHFFSSLDAAFTAIDKWVQEGQVEQVFCIGGANLYQQCISLETCNTLYITTIDKAFDCDAYFPDYSEHFTQSHSSGKQCSKKDDSLSFEFKTFTKH